MIYTLHYTHFSFCLVFKISQIKWHYTVFLNNFSIKDPVQIKCFIRQVMFQYQLVIIIYLDALSFKGYISSVFLNTDTLAVVSRAAPFPVLTRTSKA